MCGNHIVQVIPWPLLFFDNSILSVPDLGFRCPHKPENIFGMARPISVGIH